MEYHLAVQTVTNCFLVLFPSVLLVGATYLRIVYDLSSEESLFNHDCRSGSWLYSCNDLICFPN